MARGCFVVCFVGAHEARVHVGGDKYRLTIDNCVVRPFANYVVDNHKSKVIAPINRHSTVDCIMNVGFMVIWCGCGCDRGSGTPRWDIDQKKEIVIEDE